MIFKKREKILLLFSPVLTLQKHSLISEISCSMERGLMMKVLIVGGGRVSYSCSENMKSFVSDITKQY